MADAEQLALIRRGVEEWNAWREESRDVQVDLRRVDLSEADLTDAHLGSANLSRTNLDGAFLSGADLREVNLTEASLRETDFREANLCGAYLDRAYLAGAHLSGTNLSRANLRGAYLSKAYLRNADLSEASLNRAYLGDADLTRANLLKADLSRAILVETNLEGANLTSCLVYGISAWNVRLKGTIQSNLVITPQSESVIEVDSLEVAQFIYLLLNNKKIRDVIDSMTSKVVLILGRFTPERKAILDALREELRKRNYLPVLFDFQKPESRSFSETVSTLAHMARFVIADLTDPRSIPQELMRIIPHLPSVPVQPLILASQDEYGMFPDFRDYPWVLEPFRYTDQITLLAELSEKVFAPAENKAKERNRK